MVMFWDDVNILVYVQCILYKYVNIPIQFISLCKSGTKKTLHTSVGTITSLKVAFVENNVT